MCHLAILFCPHRSLGRSHNAVDVRRRGFSQGGLAVNPEVPGVVENLDSASVENLVLKKQTRSRNW
jgi:hypothetical protein